MRLQEWRRATEATAADHRRGVRNLMAFCGLGYDAWDADLATAVKYEGRDPKTYNFAPHLIEGVAGNLIMNWFDPKFVSCMGDNLDQWAFLQNVWYANKDYYKYKASSMRCIRYGMIWRGIEEIEIDRPSPDPRTWGVKFTTVRPDFFMVDPSVVSDNITRDAKRCWKHSYLRPIDMLMLFPEAEDDIRRRLVDMAKQAKGYGEMWDEIEIGTFRNFDLKKLGSKFLCIEDFHIENEKEVRYIHTLTNSQMPQESIDARKDWAAQRGIELTDDTVLAFAEWTPTLRVTTLCKDLGVQLEDKKDFRQLDGHLPFYMWSFLQIAGKSIGAMDVLIDPLQDINKREAAKQKIITQSPIAGKTILHPDLFGNSQNRQESAVADMTDASKPIIADEDADFRRTLWGTIPGVQIPGALLQDETFKIDLLSRLVRLPPAMQGFSESSRESGVLLGRKVIEGSVLQRLPMEFLIQHEQDKAEDWVKMAIKIYGGDVNINRGFYDAGGNVVTKLNVPIGYDENGDMIMQNDIARIGRVNVIIAQSKENDYLKQAKREITVAELQAMAPTDFNILSRTIVENELVQSLDVIDSEQKRRIDESTKISYDLALESMYVKLAQAKLMRQQTEMQVQQLQQPQMQQPGPNGQPVPGGAGGAPAPMPDQLRGAPMGPTMADERSPVPEMGRVPTATQAAAPQQ